MGPRRQRRKAGKIDCVTANSTAGFGLEPSVRSAIEPRPTDDAVPRAVNDAGGPARFVMVLPDYPWPTTSGGRLRAAAIHDMLAERGPVTVLAFDRPDPRFPAWEEAVVRHSRRRQQTALRVADLGIGAVLGRHVVLQRAVRAGLPTALQQVQTALAADVVVLARPCLGPFVDAARTHGAAVVADADESLAVMNRRVLRAGPSIATRLRAAIDLLSVSRMERRDYARVDQVWVSSNVELARLSGSVPADRLHVVPNVVPRPADAIRDRGINAVAFVGAYDYPPNEAAALELMGSIMPTIRRAGGPDRLVLIGRSPTPRMQREAARSPGTTVTGTVDVVLPHLEAAGVLVVPLRSGAGTRVKILEAAAAGIPVVTTRLGLEGLSLTPGEHVVLAETPQEFARAVVSLQQDRDLRCALTSAARDAVLATFGPGHLRRAMDAALLDLRPGASPPRATGDQSPEASTVIQICDIAVNNIGFGEAVALIAQWARERSGGYVCTPNVDHVVKARADQAFRAALAGARLRVPDGMWIVYGSRIAGTPLRGTVTGRLLPEAVASVLANDPVAIALFGGPPGTAEVAGAQMRRRGVRVAEALSPSAALVIGSPEDERAVCRLRESGAAVVFVGLGAPKQELWMRAHAGDLPGVVLVGVGAAIDVLAGRVHAAPRWMTLVGLEWAYRLAHEPRRLARRYLWDDPRFLWWMLLSRARRPKSA